MWCMSGVCVCVWCMSGVCVCVWCMSGVCVYVRVCVCVYTAFAGPCDRQRSGDSTNGEWVWGGGGGGEEGD